MRILNIIEQADGGAILQTEMGEMERNALIALGKDIAAKHFRATMDQPAQLGAEQPAPLFQIPNEDALVNLGVAHLISEAAKKEEEKPALPAKASARKTRKS